MEIIDGHTHAFNLGFLPIEGVLLSRHVWPWLAADVTDVFEQALEREAPGSQTAPEREALMAMLEAELSVAEAGKSPPAVSGSNLDLIAKFAVMLPPTDLDKLRPTLVEAERKLSSNSSTEVSPNHPELARLLQQRPQDEAALRLTVDRLLRTAAIMAGPVETSRKAVPGPQEITEKTVGSLIDWLVVLTQHEIRIARAFPAAWHPSAAFSSRVHLMMDMENHYPGRPPVYRDILREQFPRMLAAMKASPIKMLGFVAFDPFRSDSLDIVKRGIQQGFVGVKFYPPNGYRPICNVDEEIIQYGNAREKLTGADVDKANRELFEWCVANDIPVFTHCTSSGMESRPKETGRFSDPKGWQTLINAGFNDLRLCFGHAGGQDGWFAKNDEDFDKSYARTVVDLCNGCKNVYCDFGYFDDILDGSQLAVFVTRLERVIGENPKFGERFCYGTDWHLVATDHRAPKYPSIFESLIRGSQILAPFADAFFRTNAERYLSSTGATALATSPTRNTRIAVIAVHGVADQQPSESAEAVGTLLLTIDDEHTEGLPAYEPFQSRVIHVPLEPPAGSERSENPSSDRYHSGLEFMRSLLAGYEKTGKRSYLTNRLEGRRRQPTNANPQVRACEVDVYEMYWADLSRLGTDPLRVFGSIYHLLLHLSELGMLALRGGSREFGTSKRWSALVTIQSFAVWLLTLVIPILTLLILFTLASAVLVRFIGGPVTEALIPNRTQAASIAEHFWNGSALRIAVVAGVALISVAVTYRLASSRLSPNFRGWWLVPIGAVFVGAGLGEVVVRVSDHADVALVFIVWIAGFAFFDFLLAKYSTVISSARTVGRIAYGLVFVMFVAVLGVAFEGDRFHPREVEYAALWTLQLLNVAVSAGWICLVVAAVLAAIVGGSAVGSLPHPKCARARAAVRTSRLSLSISASGMIGIVTILFSGLLAWVIAHVAAFECMETTVFPPLFRDEWILSHPETLEKWLGAPFAAGPSCPGVPYPVHAYLRAVLLMGTTTGFPLGLLLVALCLLLLAWMALPSVHYEGKSPSKATNPQSRRAGEWLSHGLDATKVVALLWWIAVFGVLIVFAVGDLGERHGWWARVPMVEELFRKSAAISFPILQGAGTLIAASTALIVFAVVKLGGSALDVVLDVDNYLREEPRESPPRARIAERYVSLLRYIGNRPNAEVGGRAYDSIIIVAHSLGALITCDMLRYLKSQARAGRGDPALAPLGLHTDEKATIPIHLFTMGNPLRQLLNRFFPHQYEWVRDIPDNTMSGDAERADNVDPEGRLKPVPEELGIASWVNAYRSGDYVGRAIWTNDWYVRNERSGSDQWRYPVTAKPYGIAEEFCIGLGAHTHYWDDTAPDIALRLHSMIKDACG